MTLLATPSDELTGATFSPDGAHRYQLWRIWKARGDAVCFVMLNPSTANEIDNDPTVERCQRRAVEWGYAALLVVNIFALRSTDPTALYSHADPVGPDNDRAIVGAAQKAALVVCAWGGRGSYMMRGYRVLRMLNEAGVRPHALRLNRDGSPAHPLYIPYSVKPTPYADLARMPCPGAA
jgi:hypothetical protein